MGEWIKASERMPQVEGEYEWRVPSKALPGEVLVVVAEMRERGAGLKSVLSPEFDHWDGYRVVLPEGLEWRELSEQSLKRKRNERVVEIEGLAPLPCPFCKQVPKWHAVHRAGRGIMVSGRPQSLNSFWLECCAFARTPHTEDPRGMVERRNEMLA